MDQEEVLREIADAVAEEIEFDKVYLFGSRARGDFRESSDLDIAVISEEFENMKKKDRYELIIDNVRKVTQETPVGVICYTPEEFERDKDLFFPALITEEGIST